MIKIYRYFSSAPVEPTSFNSIRANLMSGSTSGFSCETQFEADMLNYIIQMESVGAVNKPGHYIWTDEKGYINEKDVEDCE